MFIGVEKLTDGCVGMDIPTHHLKYLYQKLPPGLFASSPIWRYLDHRFVSGGSTFGSAGCPVSPKFEAGSRGKWKPI